MTEDKLYHIILDYFTELDLFYPKTRKEHAQWLAKRIATSEDTGDKS